MITYVTESSNKELVLLNLILKRSVQNIVQIKLIKTSTRSLLFIDMNIKWVFSERISPHILNKEELIIWMINFIPADLEN